MARRAGDDEEQAYLEAIRRRVCGVCLDRRDDGSCGLEERVCALQEHQSQVVHAILATRSARLDEYFDAIRAQVCTQCLNQDPSGRCSVRNAGDCALETYLSLVVDAIEAAGFPRVLAPCEG